MTKASQGGVRFLMTRVVVGAGAVGTLLVLWGAIAISAAETNAASDDEALEDVLALAPAAVENAAVSAPAPAAAQAAAPEPEVIVVERQPIVYVTEYVTLPAPAVDAAAGAGQPATDASQPAAVAEPSGDSAPAQAPAAAPAAAPTPVVVTTYSEPIAPPPILPPPPPPPVAPPQPPAPTVAPAPPAPPPNPATTSSKKSKGS